MFTKTAVSVYLFCIHRAKILPAENRPVNVRVQFKVLGLYYSCLRGIFRTILLSVVSMLDAPNVNSAANVDASIAYQNWKSSDVNDSTYANKVR